MIRMSYWDDNQRSEKGRNHQTVRYTCNNSLQPTVAPSRNIVLFIQLLAFVSTCIERSKILCLYIRTYWLHNDKETTKAQKRVVLCMQGRDVIFSSSAEKNYLGWKNAMVLIHD